MRYLATQLRSALASVDRDGTRPGAQIDERIAVFHGGLGDETREDLKAAFNAEPGDHPLRILIATDSAREGVNLQNHCADLFHFDVPWNPGRMEQRNGRIDRQLQREKVVRCHYFFFAQRPEDKVLADPRRARPRRSERAGEPLRRPREAPRRPSRRGHPPRPRPTPSPAGSTPSRPPSASGSPWPELDERRASAQGEARDADRRAARPHGRLRAGPRLRRRTPSARPSPPRSSSPGAEPLVLTTVKGTPVYRLPGPRPARRRRPHLGRHARHPPPPPQEGREALGLAPRRPAAARRLRRPRHPRRRRSSTSTSSTASPGASSAASSRRASSTTTSPAPAARRRTTRCPASSSSAASPPTATARPPARRGHRPRRPLARARRAQGPAQALRRHRRGARPRPPRAVARRLVRTSPSPKRPVPASSPLPRPTWKTSSRP